MPCTPGEWNEARQRKNGTNLNHSYEPDDLNGGYDEAEDRKEPACEAREGEGADRSRRANRRDAGDDGDRLARDR